MHKTTIKTILPLRESNQHFETILQSIGDYVTFEHCSNFL